MHKTFTFIRFLALGSLLITFCEQSTSQKVYLPDKVREYLRSNELMGVKPSSVFDLFPALNKANRPVVVYKSSQILKTQDDTTTVPTDTIIATAYGNGTISPSGTVIVDSGSSPMFSIAWFSENMIDSVIVDGLNIGAETTYTFNSVNANHTITAFFGVDTSIAIDSTTFPEAGFSFPGIWAGYTQWLDYNNDGQLDAIIMGRHGPLDTNFIANIYQDSSNVFTDINAPIKPLGFEGGVAWGDYDNDGNLDLFVMGTTSVHDLNPVAKLYHNVKGVFVEDTVNQFMGLEGTATWVDYDNDGQLDLFCVGSPDGGITGFSKLYRNDHGVFTEIPTNIIGVWGATVQWADYDNDGDADLFLSGYNGTAYSKIYRNDGNGVFTDINAPLQGVNSGDAKWFDFDNDGDLDLVLTGVAPGEIPVARIYRNDGNDQFTDIGANLKPVCTSAVAVGDYDNDGNLDLAISGTETFWPPQRNATTKIYHNDGQGHFIDLHAKLPGAWFGNLSWGDYDNDGRLDLMVSGAPMGALPYTPFTKVFHNNVMHANTPPTVPTSLSVLTTSGTQSATFQWIASNDVRTPKKALTYNLRIGSTPGGIDVVSPFSNLKSGARRIPDRGNVSRRTLKEIYHLPRGTYYYSVQSVNNGYAASQFSPEQQFTVAIPEWRLVSAPFQNPISIASLYPTASPQAYSFDMGYHVEAILQHGVGYWLRFPDSNPDMIAGAPPVLDRDSITLQKGWNLVGSIGAARAISSLITEPANLINGPIYGYRNGYQKVTELEPFKGYWLKAAAGGRVILSTGNGAMEMIGTTDLESFSTLTIKDCEGGTQMLYFGTDASAASNSNRYELPPQPPAGIFDARFSTQTMVELAPPGTTHDIPIQISSAVYPVTIEWDNLSRSSAQLEIGNRISTLEGRGSIMLTDGSSMVSLKFSGTIAKPKDFLLAQNFPNPFNPTTSISYSIPEQTHVRLQIFNPLGQLISTLVDESKPPGTYTATWDASTRASGLYFYRMTAGEFVQTKEAILIR